MVQPPDYWLSQIPPFESQYSPNTATDADSCVSESLVHIIEMLQGNKQRWSPRAVAYFSATTVEGNSEANVLDSVNKVGLIPYDLWPTPDIFTWAEYYTPVPKEIWQQAVPITVEIIPPDILKSPLWTILDFTKTDHAVAQLTIGKPHDLYFDSELGGPVKNIYVPIISQHSILIKENMPKHYLIDDGGKIGVLITEGFTGNLTFADNQAHLAELKDALHVPADAPTVVLPVVPEV